MEGDCLSCMKYLMFVFNFFIFVSVPGLGDQPKNPISWAGALVRVGMAVQTLGCGLW